MVIVHEWPSMFLSWITVVEMSPPKNNPVNELLNVKLQKQDRGVYAIIRHFVNSL